MVQLRKHKLCTVLQIWRTPRPVSDFCDRFHGFGGSCLYVNLTWCCIRCVIITEWLGSSTSDRESPQNMPRSKLFFRLIERYWLSWREGTSNYRTQREYGIMNNKETSRIFLTGVIYLWTVFYVYYTILIIQEISLPFYSMVWGDHYTV